MFCPVFIGVVTDPYVIDESCRRIPVNPDQGTIPVRTSTVTESRRTSVSFTKSKSVDIGTTFQKYFKFLCIIINYMFSTTPTTVSFLDETR